MKFSRKWLFILIAIIISGGLLFFAIKLASEETYVAEESNTSLKIKNILNQIDTDKDGLKDWEEVLWGTDRNNPDSDGDGILDGEEVAQRRSPSVAGAGDIAQQTNIDTSTTDDSNMTLTEKFSREFLNSYFNQKESGKPVDEIFQENLVNEVLSQNSVSTGEVYTRKDIVITNSNSTESFKEYGNAIGSVFRINRLPQSSDDPLVILQRAFENQDESEIAKLEDIFNTSSDIVNGLLSTPVPMSLEESHLKLVNAVSAIKENFKGMSEGLADPLKAMFHVKIYTESSAVNMRETVKSIGDYFRANNITFQQEEDGILIMNTL